MSELLGNETPAEVERYWKDRRAREARERDERAQAEREHLSKPAPPQPKDPSQMDRVEYQNYLAQRKADDDARAAAHDEGLLKDRIRRAFIAAGGQESEFEEAYPSLRKKHVSAQTMSALQDGDVAVGEVDAAGQVRW